jgi:hypothetical protein
MAPLTRSIRSAFLAGVFTAALAMVSSTTRAASVELVTPRCATVGSEFLVDVRIGPNAPSVVGVQSAVDYDGAVLQFLGTEPGDAPFDLPIYFAHDAVNHRIDLAVGITPPSTPSSGNVVAQRLRFKVLGSPLDCTPAMLVDFRRTGKVRNLLTDSAGTAIVPVLTNLNELNVGPGPTITAPPDVVGTPALGSMTLFTSIGVVTASGCGPTLGLSFVRSDGKLSISAGYDRVDSPVTITWTVTDECGRTASDTQDVIVNVRLADFNQDGVVGGDDLTLVLSTWGTAGPTGDTNSDGIVNGEDLAMLLSNWG